MSDSNPQQTSGTDSETSTHPATREEYVEEAEDYERAPEGFEADWDEEDLKVPEHPVLVYPDGRESSAHLVGWGVAEDLQNTDGTFGATDVAKIIREHYVSPSFEHLDADGVRDMRIDYPDALLDAIMPGMNTEMNADGSAQVDPDTGNR